MDVLKKHMLYHYLLFSLYTSRWFRMIYIFTYNLPTFFAPTICYSKKTSYRQLKFNNYMPLGGPPRRGPDSFPHRYP